MLLYDHIIKIKKPQNFPALRTACFLTNLMKCSSLIPEGQRRAQAGHVWREGSLCGRKLLSLSMGVILSPQPRKKDFNRLAQKDGLPAHCPVKESAKG